MGRAEQMLIHQLCYDIGFPDGNPAALPLYMSGELSEVMDFFPEFEHYRGIYIYIYIY